MSKYQTHFSRDKQHRYFWAHDWSREKGVRRCPLMVIGLNPSTADENVMDPTVTRCVKFAERWGHGALWMTNLFAFRATDPADMKRADDPVGADNDASLIYNADIVAGYGGRILCAWGNHGTYRNRSLEVVRLLRAQGFKLECLKLTKAGQPWHPLYMKGDTVPFEYTWGA